MLTHAVNIHSCHPNRHPAILHLARTSLLMLFLLASNTCMCLFFSSYICMQYSCIYRHSLLRDLLDYAACFALGNIFHFFDIWLADSACSNCLVVSVNSSWSCLFPRSAFADCHVLDAVGEELEKAACQSSNKVLLQGSWCFIFLPCYTMNLQNSRLIQYILIEKKFMLRYLLFLLLKDEKNQMMTTNVWVKQVSDYKTKPIQNMNLAQSCNAWL